MNQQQVIKISPPSLSSSSNDSDNTNSNKLDYVNNSSIQTDKDRDLNRLKWFCIICIVFLLIISLLSQVDWLVGYTKLKST